MLNVMVLCGGESSEHQVSLQSANSIIRFLPKDKFKAIPVAITKEGKWVTGTPLILNSYDPKTIYLNPSAKEAKLENGKLNGEKVDVVFPIIHGTSGEDGCIQGLLELEHLPYVGPSVIGSAVGMDKDVMKRLLLQAGIRCAKSITVYRWTKQLPSYAELSSVLGKTMFVKPCNCGSSVGISKCKSEVELVNAIELALRYDNKVLIEEYIQGREIELSIIGNDDPQVSLPGEIVPDAEFYSYDAKYIDGSSKLIIPADLTPEATRKLQKIAKKAFRVLECMGLGRVDFLVKADGTAYLNEINTLPGFTNISMYPKLWHVSGLPFPKLMEQLIQLALDRKKMNDSLLRK